MLGKTERGNLGKLVALSRKEVLFHAKACINFQNIVLSHGSQPSQYVGGQDVHVLTEMR